MSPELWESVKDLFLELVDSTPDNRLAVLERTPEPLRSEVRRMLENNDAAESGDTPVDAPIVSASFLQRLIADARVFSPGQLLLNRFEIRSFLGAGGMGEVFEAFDSSLGELVAVKAIRPALAADPDMVRRFRSEVQRARHVSHPNVCRVHDIFAHTGESGIETPFLTMELVTGPTLAQYLNGRSLPFDEINGIAVQLCDGLHAAHSADLVHRDLKTANVIIQTKDNAVRRAVITDFGLARRLATAEPANDLGHSNQIAGTPAYMAPELLTGAEASRRSDIYALGVVLFRMAAGKYPFTHTEDIALALAERRSPPSLRRMALPVPSYWANAVSHCLHPDPLARPESAASLAAILRSPGIGRRAALATAVGVAAVAAVWKFNTGRATPPVAASPVQLGPFTGDGPSPSLPGTVANLFRLTLASSKIARLVDAKAPASPSSTLSGVVTTVPAGYSIRVSLAAPNGRSNSVTEVAAALKDLPHAVRRASVALALLSAAETYAVAGNIPLDEVDTTSIEAMEALTAALAEYSSGKLDLALELLRTATEKDKEFALAYVYTAIILSTMRREYLALAPAATAVNLKSRLSPRVRPHAEAVYAFMCGDYGNALLKYEEVARLYPNEAPLQRHLAQMYTILYRHNDTLPVAARAVAIDPANPQNLMLAASANADAGNFQQAAAVTATAANLQPDSPLTWVAQGYVALLAGRFDDAIAAYERVTVRRDLEAFARSFQIRALLLSGRVLDAERRIQLALGVVTSEKDRAHEDLFRYWQGQLHILAGNPARAVAEARVLASRDPLPPSLFSLRAAAEIAAAAGDTLLCRDTAAATAKIAKAYPSRRSLGIAGQCQALHQFAAGDPAACLLQLEQAEAHWKDISIWWSIAETARHLRNWTVAAAAYRRVHEHRVASYRFECILNWLLSPAYAAICLREANQINESNLLSAEFLKRWGAVEHLPIVRQLSLLQATK